MDHYYDLMCDLEPQQRQAQAEADDRQGEDMNNEPISFGLGRLCDCGMKQAQDCDCELPFSRFSHCQIS